jgi:hypothetical protein
MHEPCDGRTPANVQVDAIVDRGLAPRCCHARADPRPGRVLVSQTMSAVLVAADDHVVEAQPPER